VFSVAFDNKGLLASGSSDTKVILWNTSTWAQFRTLNDSRSAVELIAFNNNGLLACGNDDREVIFWNNPSFFL